MVVGLSWPSASAGVGCLVGRLPGFLDLGVARIWLVLGGSVHGEGLAVVVCVEPVARVGHWRIAALPRVISCSLGVFLVFRPGPCA